MSEEQQEAPGVGLTLKAGKEFSDPWITPRAGSVAGLRDIIDQFKADPALLRDVSVLASEFHRVYLEVKNGAPAPAPASYRVPEQTSVSISATPTEPTPQASQPAAGGFCASCGTGLDYKAFTSKAGKDIKGYFCPNGKQRGDGHTSKFI